ncbi:hypothetical protein [Acidocella aromatica]|uniref:Uncharacterized protein n=1 Tax=Acidocella aromatica TaxID=1303579 RepID=A0A840VR47_9PROT|nr:hypothetical protein [Acidocella aromatica]MBB5372762.1 hypothetical protein [Acidocella aromatica]
MPNHKPTILAACAAKPPVPDNSFQCRGMSDCAAKWAEAVAWANENAPRGLAKQTDNLIQAYGSTDYDNYGTNSYFTLGLANYNTTPGFIIQKTMNPDGTAAITFHTNCASLSQCVPSQETARESFAAAIGG